MLGEKLTRNDDARALLCAVFADEADLLPDEINKTITVRLHHLANPCSADGLRFLCDELNQTETIFRGSNFRIIYDLVSRESPSRDPSEPSGF